MRSAPRGKEKNYGRKVVNPVGFSPQPRLSLVIVEAPLALPSYIDNDYHYIMINLTHHLDKPGFMHKTPFKDFIKPIGG